MTQQIIGGKFIADYPDLDTGALTPASGYKLHTYVSGTTTNQATYSDAGLTAPNTNPITLDTRGEASVFLTPGVAYTIVLKTATGSTIWTRDGVISALSPADISGDTGAGMLGFLYSATYAAGTVGKWLQDLATSVGSSFLGFIQAGTGAIARTAQAKMREIPSVADFGATPTSASDQTALLNAAFTTLLGKEIRIPTGTYRVDGTLVISAGTKVIMEKGARLYRQSAYSAATTPVVYLIDSFSELRGGTIQTDNGSPNGVIVLGNMSNADNRNAWYWRFSDCDLQGNGVASSIGWAVISGQISFPLNANYFGLVQNVNTKNFDIGCFFNEDANAHNVVNVQFWQCKTANIWLRGAYANNFSNMFFHGGAANGCIGIKLSNKAGGPDTNADNNVFAGFTCETGGSLDQAVYIDTNCTSNILIGTTNVSGGNTVNNYNNNIQITNTGIGGFSVLPGAGARTDGVISRVVTPITPAGLLGVGDDGACLVVVETTLSTNASLNRTDLLLISARNSGFSGSAVTVVSSAFTATGTAGEPVAAAYALSFASGATLPRLTVNLTPTGPDVIYNVRMRITKV